MCVLKQDAVHAIHARHAFHAPHAPHAQIDAKELHEGEEVTLMDWGNAFVRKVVKDAGQSVYYAVYMTLCLIWLT